MSRFGPPQPIMSWGRTARPAVPSARPEFLDQLPAALRGAGDRPALGIGLGRSYGDSGLNGVGVVVDTTALDRVIAFDPATGVLRGEAGLSLSAILRVAVPHGWFLPTTPGTRFVTLGGAVANDVHGKNHHRAGTLGAHVRRIGLLRSDRNDDAVIELAPDEHGDLFRATIAGLGLTGLIAWVELQLVRIPGAHLAVETLPFTGWSEFAALARDSAATHEHTVAWIDCTSGDARRASRGLFSRANWLADGIFRPHDDGGRFRFPVELPSLCINRMSLKAFNAIYYGAGALKRGRRQRVHYAPFFHPLDAIGNWNRAYGRAGFYQYQCVVPHEAADRAIPAMLAEIARSGQGSCLAVLKTFGAAASPGMLSFPREGTTLALDFPNRGVRTHALFERLDGIVAQARGRLYPAKDARMPPALFRAGYPLLDAFARHLDPRFQSDFWRRMTLQ